MTLSGTPAVLPPGVAVVPPRGLVARLGRRLCDVRGVMGLPVSATQMSLRLQASIAESLLVARLRARSQRTSSPDVLARGLHVVQVTCDHWFPAESPAPAASRTYRTLI